MAGRDASAQGQSRASGAESGAESQPKSKYWLIASESQYMAFVAKPPFSFGHSESQ